MSNAILNDTQDVAGAGLVYDVPVFQCTNSDGNNAAPFLLRRLAAPYLLRGLATPYLLRRLAAPYFLRGLATPYILRRHYSLVITSRPEVAFVTPAIPMDHSNIEWFFLRNIRKLDQSCRLDRRSLDFIQKLIVPIRRVSFVLVQRVSFVLVQRVLFVLIRRGLGLHSKVRLVYSIGGCLVCFVRRLFGWARLEVFCLDRPEVSYLACPEVSELVRQSRPKGFRPLFSTTSQGILYLILMAKKDMHTYVSRLKDTKLETLIATYDIPLDLRPRLPDHNFRMINLPARDTTIGIYSRIFDSSGVRIPFSSFLLAVLKYFKVHISQLVPLGLSKTLSKQGDWFSFARREDPAPVYKVPTSFNQNHIDQLKAHIMKLHDILEGVLIWFGLSIVWRNPMCDPVLRRPDNTVMSIYDFLCMPSLDKVTIKIREEPHGLDTSILGRFADRTNHLLQRDDHAAKQNAFTGPEISTNVAKKAKSNKKGSGAGSSGHAVEDEVDQTYDGTLDDDDDQHNGLEFAMEGIENLNDVSQYKEVEAHAELSRGVRRATRASFYTSYDADEIANDGNVDPYCEARVSNTDGDVLERDLLLFISRPYYIPYPYEEEVSRLMDELGVLKSRCQTAKHKLSCWDKKHRKYRNERDTLAMEKAKIEEELIGTNFLKSGEFNWAFAGVLNTATSVGVKRGLCMGRTDKEFKGLSHRVVGFIPDAKEKFDRVVAAFLGTTFPFLDKVSQNSQSSLQDIARLEPDRVTSYHQTSSATASLRANTHV
uniref:Transposase (Putative), gypsy type n=1 Tax=Tanacetum cinerariifolium TaxID=118510 RepID=A0A6L2J9P8_TANCI|nr:hypothetical protein [Tanacetum cinerariifolium]